MGIAYCNRPHGAAATAGVMPDLQPAALVDRLRERPHYGDTNDPLSEAEALTLLNPLTDGDGTNA